MSEPFGSTAALHHPPPLYGLLLAAGQGQRFRAAGGQDKLCTPGPSGLPLALSAVRQLCQAPLDRVLVVVRPDNLGLIELLHGQPVQLHRSDWAQHGMGASLADGARQLPDGAAVVVALADMPALAASTLAAICQALRAGASMVQPVYAGQPGHPVGFAPVWLPLLRQLHGDQGARSLLRQHADLVLRLPVNDPGCVQDVDTPQDWQRLGSG